MSDNKLMKIKNVTDMFNISARTLRYYEDMELITSIRTESYAYRMYDKIAIKRLQQILILRKLKSSIKDIKRIFNSNNSDIILDVLSKKIDNIDDEIALLHELKNIIIDFIHYIESVDFSKDSDVKSLYEKTKEIEKHLINVDYNGNTSSINRLFDIADKLKKAPEVRIVEIKKFRAVTSGADIFANIFSENGFNNWQEKHNNLIKNLIYASPDFMWFENNKCNWIWAIEDWVTIEDTSPYKIIDFEGGLYAAVMSVDGDDDINGSVYNGIINWLDTSGFELNEYEGHRTLCHMVNPSQEIKKALGYNQLDIYVPIKIRK